MAELQLLEPTRTPTLIVGSVRPPAQPFAVGLPASLLAQLLQQVASTPIQRPSDLLPTVRILGLIVATGLVLRFTSATQAAIDDRPLIFGLLELVGLVSVLGFLSRHALRQQKRAELMVRIDALRRDLLG